MLNMPHSFPLRQFKNYWYQSTVERITVKYTATFYGSQQKCSLFAILSK